MLFPHSSQDSHPVPGLSRLLCSLAAVFLGLYSITPGHAGEKAAEDVSYLYGHELGEALNRQGRLEEARNLELDLDAVYLGIKDGVSGKPLAFSREKRRQLDADLLARRKQLAVRRQQEMERELAENKREAAAFMQKNAGRPGVVTTGTGLQYQVLRSAAGGKPGPLDKVRVHYAGSLTDGTEFDSSIARGRPAEFPLSGVIRGWTEGLQLMPTGAKFRFFIPPELGYGEAGAGGRIPPNAVLIFDVELLDIL